MRNLSALVEAKGSMDEQFLSISTKLNAVDTAEPRWGSKFKKFFSCTNCLLHEDTPQVFSTTGGSQTMVCQEAKCFFPSTKQPGFNRTYIHVGFETTPNWSRQGTSHCSKIFTNLSATRVRQQIHRCFWQVLEWIWCWDITKNHLRTFKGGFTLEGTERKSVSLVIFCLLFWRLDMFLVSSCNHTEHVPLQLQRSPRLSFKLSFDYDYTSYFHNIMSTSHHKNTHTHIKHLSSHPIPPWQRMCH